MTSKITEINKRIETLKKDILSLNSIADPSDDELMRYGYILEEKKQLDVAIDTIVANYKENGLIDSKLTELCSLRCALDRLDDAILERLDLISDIPEENMSPRLKHNSARFINKLSHFDLNSLLKSVSLPETPVINIALWSRRSFISKESQSTLALAASSKFEDAPVITHKLIQRGHLEIIARCYQEDRKYVLKVCDGESGELSTEMDGEKISLNIDDNTIISGVIENGKLIITF